MSAWRGYAFGMTFEDLAQAADNAALPFVSDGNLDFFTGERASNPHVLVLETADADTIHIEVNEIDFKQAGLQRSRPACH